MLGNFSLLTHPRDVSSLFLKEEGSSPSDSKQAQEAGMKLIQHCHNDVAIVAGLCWRCFSSLCFLDSNYIHNFGVFSCIYHFNRFSFVELSFICDAYGVTPLFPPKFCLLLLELIISQFLLISIITLYIHFYNGNCPLWINQGFNGVRNIFDYDILYYF